MNEKDLLWIETWNDLYEVLRRKGFVQTAILIRSWQNEWMPDEEDDLLPRKEDDGT